MGHGLPSWKKYRAIGPVYEEIRLAEHAARLGSLLTFDRRGDIVWQDDFESGLNKWEKIHDGKDAASCPNMEQAKSGGISAQLIAGSDGAHRVEYFRNLPYPAISPLGFEVSFKPQDDYEEFRIWINLYTGGLFYRSAISHHQSSLEYRIRKSDGKWGAICTAPSWQMLYAPFHTLKLVIDPESPAYVRAIFDHQTLDISGYGPHIVEDFTPARININFTFIGREGYNDWCYVDDAIITQNEP